MDFDSAIYGALPELMIFFMCHPSWDIRKMTCNVARKIITSSPQLLEDLFFEFSNFLSMVGEKLYTSKMRLLLLTTMVFLAIVIIVMCIMGYDDQTGNHPLCCSFRDTVLHKGIQLIAFVALIVLDILAL